MEWMDTPQTVMTTRAPAVLKSHRHVVSICSRIEKTWGEANSNQHAHLGDCDDGNDDYDGDRQDKETNVT